MEHCYKLSKLQLMDGDVMRLFKFAVDVLPDNSHFVELGAGTGCSTSFLTVEIINSGKNMRLDVVDNWEGSLSEPDERWSKRKSICRNNDLYYEFMMFMEENGLLRYITPIRMTTELASSLYKDDTLNFVYIDADHSYEAVKNDIFKWYPKIKTGGMLSGHDYHWGGVRRAVDEFFGNSVNVVGRRVWYVDKLFTNFRWYDIL